jgi:hypothetical protein
VLYAVCTNCSFLRAFSREASAMPELEACPACGEELMIRRTEGRFPPAYVSRVGLQLLATPSLGGGEQR